MYALTVVLEECAIIVHHRGVHRTDGIHFFFLHARSLNSEPKRGKNKQSKL